MSENKVNRYVLIILIGLLSQHTSQIDDTFGFMIMRRIVHLTYGENKAFHQKIWYRCRLINFASMTFKENMFLLNH